MNKNYESIKHLKQYNFRCHLNVTESENIYSFAAGNSLTLYLNVRITGNQRHSVRSLQHSLLNTVNTSLQRVTDCRGLVQRRSVVVSTEV